MPRFEGGTIRRGLLAEESPDKKGHRTAEIAGRGNFTYAVTENDYRESGKGENARDELTIYVSDGI